MSATRHWNHYPITTRELTVLRVADVTPGMRRVTIGGPGLQAHTAPSGHPVAPFRSDGFDDEFKLFLRHPDAERALVPEQLDGVLDWPRHPHLVSRTYTVRRWDAEAGEIDVDLVIHGDGPATTWARTARPGEAIQVAGPKMSGDQPEADWLLIAADETGLPAVGRWLEELPDGARAQVFVEVAEESHRQGLVVPAGVELTWLVRHGAPAGSTPLLLDALRSAEWWPGEVFAWIAGEALTLAPIRRWLRRDKGLSKSAVDVTGYWRRPPTAATVDPANDATDPAPPDLDLHEMSELLPPMALRVAATVGLGEVLSEEPCGMDRITGVTGGNPTGLGKLLRYLSALGVVEISGEGGSPRYRWAESARDELGDEWYLDRLRLDGPWGRAMLASLSLLTAVRTGEGADEAALLGAVGLGDGDADTVQERVAVEDEQAAFVADPLIRSPFLADTRRLRISGPGAGRVALTSRRLRPEVEVSVLVDEGDAPAVRAVLEGSGVVVEVGGLVSPPVADVDTHVWLDLLDRHRDEEATVRLHRCLRAMDGGRIVLVGEALDESALDEHECEDDLLRFASGGAGLRTAAERDALINRAGLTVTDAGTVGWGFDVRVVR